MQDALQARLAQSLRRGDLRACRHQAEVLAQSSLTRLLCRITGGRARPGLVAASSCGRVLAGPLKGRLLVMPGAERPSYLLGTYERHLVNALSAHVGRGRVAYDVGAHIGYLSLVLARLVGEEGTVYAFEADPRNAECLRANVTLNGARTIVPLECAVSDRHGEVEFASFAYSTVSHIRTERTPGDAIIRRVPSLSIDEFVFNAGNPAPNFIKIDVEGAEAQVLNGAQRTLQEFHPAVVAEVRAGLTAGPILRLMTELGYEQQTLKGAAVADVLFTPRAHPPPSPSIGKGSG